MNYWNLVQGKRKRKQQNKQLMRELKAAHYPTYVELKAAMNRAPWIAANSYEAEQLKMDVTGMVCEGVGRGEGLDSIMGGDADGFVQELFRSCKKKTWQEYIIMVLLSLLSGALLVYFTYAPLQSKNGMLYITWKMVYAMVVSGCYMAALSVFIVCRAYMKQWQIVAGSVLIHAGFASAIYGWMYWVEMQALPQRTLGSVNAWIPAAAIALGIGGLYVLKLRATAKGFEKGEI